MLLFSDVAHMAECSYGPFVRLLWQSLTLRALYPCCMCTYANVLADVFSPLIGVQPVNDVFSANVFAFRRLDPSSGGALRVYESCCSTGAL